MQHICTSFVFVNRKRSSKEELLRALHENQVTKSQPNRKSLYRKKIDNRSVTWFVRMKYKKRKGKIPFLQHVGRKNYFLGML